MYFFLINSQYIKNISAVSSQILGYKNLIEIRLLFLKAVWNSLFPRLHFTVFV